jgi:hypothetical protein
LLSIHLFSCLFKLASFAWYMYQSFKLVG